MRGEHFAIFFQLKIIFRKKIQLSKKLIAKISVSALYTVSIINESTIQYNNIIIIYNIVGDTNTNIILIFYVHAMKTTW